MANKQEAGQLEQWLRRTVWMAGCDIDTERRQAREEGRDLSEVEADFTRLIEASQSDSSWNIDTYSGSDEAWLNTAGQLVDRVQTLPMRRDYRFHEPNDLDGIRNARPATVAGRRWNGSRDEWLERLHGGLLGRICGCMLGKPVECWDRGTIQAFGEVTGNWPPTDYWRKPTSEENEQLDARKVKHKLQAWADPMLKDNMDGFVEDDDINYTTIGFAVVREHGADFTPVDVAHYWCQNVPILRTATAERVAYRNFVTNVLPPNSAVRRNPYREWIGAQIRADYYGYANPGNPERAADWAWRDASISHIKNGIYGAMWVAAMLAQAYTETDWTKIIRAGLAQIPAECRLSRHVKKVLTLHSDHASYDKVIEALHSQWDECRQHDWCHVISNAQVVATALLYGDDDYEQTIMKAVMPGFDTDCNGATCGSLWGIVHGVSALPSKWTAPMKDTVRTGVTGYHEVAISKLAADMLSTAIQYQQS